MDRNATNTTVPDGIDEPLLGRGRLARMVSIVTRAAVSPVLFVRNEPRLDRIGLDVVALVLHRPSRLTAI
ncbi:MAG: hypothetical protein BWY17_05197 [Deltaproteobacteria bacterium ADurb.Bin207]|nr:MAG: hypothetical protein BWY17_05197 [Deltaproteobacteria bacterium ADurb.Bin207]